MNYVREKKAPCNHRKSFPFRYKNKHIADQGQLRKAFESMKAFESLKANCVILNKLEGKRESYFVTNTYVNS